ncbi:uncharacterized protein J8A68_000435 [[Candida] subhashii]|uniref:Uncharacterized protein n=1 Tax=[Candida] subhashii TaxID=561895 RepID=A0A8J5V1W8_9ASCO|nr:uncharacterized protein J8A68_000435 [[Candida] subhashii]KAG7666005.1 hypothetical protein J8A68_000435 [[Candida] subhashii]
MKEKESLPSYNESIEQDQPPPPVGSQPLYFSNLSPQGWSFVINNAFFGGRYTIFVSKDASDKWNVFKKNNTPEVKDLQAQGYGIPLLKGICPLNPFTTKFLTFKRYLPTADHPFDVEKDHYEFCVVNVNQHFGYKTFIFHFRPDPEQRKLDFELMVFMHSGLPIVDYIYKGEKHRWIDETAGHGFRMQWQVKFGFKHCVLSENQPSLTDNWDGVNHKLNKSPNPLIEGTIATLFSMSSRWSSRFPKNEYYGEGRGVFGEAEPFFKLGHAELNVDDIYNQSASVDYESIFSVNQDVLVDVCVATVLKRQRDIDEESRHHSSSGGGP